MKEPVRLTKTARIALFAMLVALAAGFLFSQQGHPRTRTPRGAAAVSAATAGTDAVAAFAITRDRQQSQAMSEDQAIASSPDASAATRAKAQADYLFLADATASQEEAESLLSVKGYPETAVLVTAKGAVVVVGKPALTSSEVMLIATTVSKVTGVPLQSISIVPR